MARALVVFLLGCISSALGRSDVCDLPMTSMYVPDVQQKQFPVGFLGCVDVANVTLPRCRPCDCRELQSVRNGGNIISWGVCIEDKNASSCLSQFCGNSTKFNVPVTTQPPIVTTTPTTTASSGFRPGQVQAPDESGNSTMKQQAMNSEGGLSSASSGSSTSTGASSTPIVIAMIGAVAAVGAIAAFAFARAGQDDRLSTPKEDNFKPYKDTKPSKPLPPSRSHVPQYKSMEPPPPPPPTEQPSLKKVGDEYRHDTTSDEEQESGYEFDDSQRSDFSALNMDTVRSLVSDIDDSDECDSHRGSRMTVAEEDEDENDEKIDTLRTNDSTLSSEYWRDSNDSMLFSNSSALSYYVDKKPRKSIAF